MTEKQNGKKWRLVKSIFKWLFIITLALLLLVGLIFRAPLKVLTLLAIFLLACTVLPRPARKWFWLSIGVLVIVLVVWIFLPDDNEGWRPYTFDEERARLQAKYAIPDEDNAALLYAQLLSYEQKYERQDQERQLEKKENQLMKEAFEGIPIADINEWFARFPHSSFYPSFWNRELDDLTRYKAWSSKDYPHIAQWLQTHKSAITNLIKASQKNECRFLIPCDSFSISKLMKRTGTMSRWALLLIRSANNDLGDERIDRAIEKCIAVLQMAKHQYQHPLLVQLLVGFSIEERANQQLTRFIIEEKIRNEHLNIIEEALANVIHDWRADWLRILEYEKLIYKNTVCGLFFQINSKGKVRSSRDPTALIRAEFTKEMVPTTFCQQKLNRLFVIFRWFYMPSTPQKVVSIIDKAYEKYYVMADPEYDWQQEPKETSIFSTSTRLNYSYMVKLFADMLTETIYKIHDMYMWTSAEHRVCRIIVLLRKYKNKQGYWPESLEGIKSPASSEVFVDPINDGDFVYKLTEENFTLYSRGKNNIDEKGERGIKEQGGTRLDDTLFWPQKFLKVK